MARAVELINVLGEDYNIIKSNEEKHQALKDCNGFFDFSTKEIIIRDDLDKTGVGLNANGEVFLNQTVRHELIHAFMEESGVVSAEWCNDELLVDWIAIQLPKMVKAMKDYL